MDYVSKHISYKEAIRSDIAFHNGIDNFFTEEQLVRMKLVAEKVFEPMRIYFNVPIFVSSFFRNKKVNKNSNQRKDQKINNQHAY